MRKRVGRRLRVVYVIGAGFSADLGYPLTSNLLSRVWRRLESDEAGRLAKVVEFHHPRFRRDSLLSFPDIEELLTEISANEDLLKELRPAGPFGVEQLRMIRDQLLQTIAEWFHEIYATHPKATFVRDFVAKARHERAWLISFNWDLELDTQIAAAISSTTYGLSDASHVQPGILKPHGSLNWYSHSFGKHIKEEKRVRLWPGRKREESIWAFTFPRAPKSSERDYVPWIVPPTHLKNFQHPMLRQIWKRCVDLLSVADKIYFLGYSLPTADWHSRYIFRCGFHNQQEGLPRNGGSRMPATGRADIYIVNPDQSAARRIEGIVGWKCHWIPERIQDWAKTGFSDS